MKKALLITGWLLVGCAEVKYPEMIAHPASSELAGFWQSFGEQSELISPEAIASLVIENNGSTLDCRQWQRVIALPGKLQQKDNGRWQNFTERGDVYSLSRQGSQLTYAGMTLTRVSQLTPDCNRALQKAQNPAPVMPDSTAGLQ